MTTKTTIGRVVHFCQRWIFAFVISMPVLSVLSVMMVMTIVTVRPGTGVHDSILDVFDAAGHLGSPPRRRQAAVLTHF